MTTDRMTARGAWSRARSAATETAGVPPAGAGTLGSGSREVRQVVPAEAARRVHRAEPSGREKRGSGSAYLSTCHSFSAAKARVNPVQYG